MWKYFYDSLLQYLTSPWASFITKNTAQGRLVRDSFYNSIYQNAGFILFSVCLISCFLYYFYFNRRFGRYYSTGSWLKWLFITSLIIGILTFFVGRASLNSFICPTMPLIAWLSVMNFIYSIFLFILSSVLCQLVAISVRRLTPYDISPMGSRTPF